MSRTVLHVLKNKDVETDGQKWVVKEENNETILGGGKTQQQAIIAAQKIVFSQIKVHGRNNEFVRELTYGLDPEKSEG